MDYTKRSFKNRFIPHTISVPFIWGMLIPIVIADICIEMYHRVCFPLYGLPYVKRSQYIRVDRQRLSYLNPLEKIACAYCGYANGFLHYASTIAGITEKYFCGIMHEKKKAKGLPFYDPAHHKDFLSYGDKEALDTLRKR